jgi:F-type H+-transporting ATPase subunit c
MVAVAAMMVAAPAFAQETQAAAEHAAGTVSLDVIAMYSIVTAGFALAIAAGLGALGQGKAIASAAEGIARNPSAAGEIRGVLILGLVLIESLSIYVLLISLILFFLKPFSPAAV